MIVMETTAAANDRWATSSVENTRPPGAHIAKKITLLGVLSHTKQHAPPPGRKKTAALLLKTLPLWLVVLDVAGVQVGVIV